MSHTTVGVVAVTQNYDYLDNIVLSREDADKIWYHHNGDFSGDVKIVVPSEYADYELDHRTHRVSIKVPFEDLKHLVANYVLQRKVEFLEGLEEDDDVLGVV